MFLLRTFLVLGFVLKENIILSGSTERSEEVKQIDENLAIIEKQITQFGETEGKSLQRAQAWANYGLILQLKDVKVHEGGGALQPKALDAFNRALEYSDETDYTLRIQVYQHKGILLKMMGRGEDALLAHQEVLNIASNPYDKSSAIYHYAEALSLLGRVPEAIEKYRESLEIQPDALASYLPLVKALRELNQYTKEDWIALLKEMQNRLKKYEKGNYDISRYTTAALWQGSSTAHMGSEIYWAIFEVADKIGDYDLAWKNLEKAHEIQKARFSLFDEPPNDSRSDSILQIFKPGFWPDPPVGLDTMVPVFIVGMMRSGSTLTETMLDAHKDVWGMGEDSVFNPVLQELRDELVTGLSSGQESPGIVKKIVTKYGKKVVDRMMFLANEATASTPRSGNIKRVVDKMLFNYRNIGFIHLLFPKAVIIHTIRDPLDTLLSCYKHKFDDGGLEWSLDPAYLVSEYVQYLEIIHHFRKVLPGRVLDVSYERMVADPEKTIREVVKRLKLDWDPNVLEFYKTNRTVQTHSMAQVRHNIYSKSVGGWRRYAKHMKAIIREFNKHIPQLRAKGALPFPDFMNWDFDPEFDYGFDDSKNSSQSLKDQQVSGVGKKKGKKDDSMTCSESDSGTCEVGQQGSGEIAKKKGAGDTLKSGKKTVAEKKKTAAKAQSKEERRNQKSKKEKKSRKSKKSSKPKNKRTRLERGGGNKKSNKKLDELLASVSGVADKTTVKQVQSFLAHRSGNPKIDEAVSIGYILINTRQYDQAISLYKSLFEIDQYVLGAYIGYGSALAMSGDYEGSLKMFSKLLDIDPYNFEGYERRAEVLMAMGNRELAKVDYDFAISNAPAANKVPAYIGRANLHSHNRAYLQALKDYEMAESLVGKDNRNMLPVIFHGMGRCHKEIGNTDEAVVVLKKAIELNRASPEYNLEMAQVYIQASLWKEALPYFQAALKINSRFKMAYGYRGLMYQNLGQCENALQDIKRAIEIEPNEPSPMVIGTACLQSLGKFSDALKMYDRMLELSPTHDGWFTREVLFYIYVNLDNDIFNFNLDAIVDPRVKEGRSQRNPWTETFPASYVSDISKAARAKMKKDGDGMFKMNPRIKEVLEITDSVAKWVQLDTPGFMPNIRQHRQFGISALHMAQLLRQHVKLLRAGQEGLLIPDVASSNLKWFGLTPSKKKSGHHVFGWRDLFDIAARWRQLSEPLDVVWWNDGLPERDKMHQYGLRTHMVSGVNKVVRYYPYHDMAFNLTKTLMITEQYYDHKDNPIYPDEVKKELIEEAESIQELHKVAGFMPFYVLSPCYSLKVDGRVMEGTRITLTGHSPEGYEFFINSPSTPERNLQYAEEMDYVFRNFVSALMNVRDGQDQAASDVAFERALEVFFYWVNYAPLSRGTSATGYAALMACVVAMGERIISPVPKRKQLDWEGILTPEPGVFVDRVKSWLSERGPSSISKKWLDSEPGYRLNEVFGTMRSMYVACGELD